MDVDSARIVAELGNHKNALTTAYDAIRSAVECHMNASGLRLANQPGAHRAAIDYAAEEMADLMNAAEIALYDQLRTLRHGAEYAFSSTTRTPIRADDAKTAIALADKLVKAVIRWWSRKRKS